ncbi:cyclophilin-like fold protein [Butyrivibrio sp. YAB3001]|uniref:cyclophilin-like fold protein n=1 Tax=Butyrivibrio sp. YAB3001 TaxID=1520812 RepID=UPI0008F63AEE|nr:cyclophilin-like fold protein [Butyrivibrio sp. YAB3001]SFC02811.1 RRNA methyltransferase AviRa [Butyrivibrio sp. YAB3001]
MNYLYCPAGNYEDFASGRVIHGAKGIPNFPVRLIAEIFGRAMAVSPKKDHLVVYDPCCGGAYSLAIIGFFYGRSIEKIYGSDISEDMIECARKNLELTLSIDGKEMPVTWEDNASVNELKEILPLKVNMSMYGGFEQVGSIGQSISRDDKQITTEFGDIVLYSGNQIEITV